MFYLSLGMYYVIIFLAIMKIEPLFKEWGNPLFNLWYIGLKLEVMYA